MKCYFVSLCVAALLGLSACASDNYQAIEPAAGGGGHYVSPSRKPLVDSSLRRDDNFETASASALMDPLEAHMRARKMVNPSDTRTQHVYTKKTTPYNNRMDAKKFGNNSAPPPMQTRNIITNVPIPNNKPQVELASLATSMPLQVYDAPMPSRKPNYVDAATTSLDQQISQGDEQILGTIVRPLAKPELGSAPTLQMASTAPVAHTTIRDIRIGAHPGKTRVVFDLDDAPVFDKAISTDHKHIRARFKQSYWGTQLQKQYPNQPYLLGYQTQNDNGDTIVTLSFKRPVKIESSTVYPPEGGNSNYRLLLDITPR